MDAATAHGGEVSGVGAGRGGRERMQTGRGQENRHSHGAKTNRQTKEYRKQEKKNNKKRTNRKRIGNLLIKAKSYTCLHPGADLYHAPHRPGNECGGHLWSHRLSCELSQGLVFSSWFSITLLSCGRHPSPTPHKLIFHSQGCVRAV